MIPFELKLRAHPKASLVFDDVRQSALHPRDRVRLSVEDRQHHPACDVHAHGIRNHAALGGQNTADGQTVADVCIGHQCSRHGHGQTAGIGHLHDGVFIKTRAPLTPWRDGIPLFVCRRIQNAGQCFAQRISEILRGCTDDRRKVSADCSRIRTGVGEFLRELFSVLQGLSIWETQRFEF